MEPTTQRDGWESWSKHVLKELERLNDNMERSNQEFARAIGKLEVNIAILQVKSGMFGLIGGLIPVLVLYFVKH